MDRDVEFGRGKNKIHNRSKIGLTAIKNGDIFSLSDVLYRTNGLNGTIHG
nr:MAG TPA: hypothetical protein [Caudoviricetes sp.]